MCWIISIMGSCRPDMDPRDLERMEETQRRHSWELRTARKAQLDFLLGGLKCFGFKVFLSSTIPGDDIVIPIPSYTIALYYFPDEQIGHFYIFLGWIVLTMCSSTAGWLWLAQVTHRSPSRWSSADSSAITSHQPCINQPLTGHSSKTTQPETNRSPTMHQPLSHHEPSK